MPSVCITPCKPISIHCLEQVRGMKGNGVAGSFRYVRVLMQAMKALRE